MNFRTLIYKSFHSHSLLLARKRSRHLQSVLATDTDKNQFGRKDILQTYYDQSFKDIDSQSTDQNKDWYLNKAINISLSDKSDKLDKSQESKEFIPLWMKNNQTLTSTDELNQGFTLENIVNILRNEHGKNVVVINMTEKCDYTDCMIIVEGKSKRHIYGMLESVRLFVLFS